MNDKTAINIGLILKHEVIDLRIPNQVTLDRLGELLQEALAVMNLTLPPKFSLELINKPINIKPDIPLAHYPIGNGDQLLVKEME
ncbi:EsaB/YukD family protein [Enterococcus sp. AZ109]|uniref:EsaB/YukD family protein n=1 Tax=Enterococcus sp. AZ109 TaxID=2774634 RepID=UPI003F29E4B2